MVKIEHWRHGAPIPYRWGWWHFDRMFFVAALDGGNLARGGRHVVQQEYVCTDPADGEVLHFLPGDVLSAWR